MDQIQGKVVIVTGGSDGIGKALVELYLNKGAKVATCGRNYQKLYQLQAANTGKPLFIHATDVSKEKMQQALQARWEYTGEMFTMNELEKEAYNIGIGVDVSQLQQTYQQQIETIVQEAGLQMPTAAWMQTGGKNGVHTEHLGYILAEMQYLQRAYPNMGW